GPASSKEAQGGSLCVCEVCRRHAGVPMGQGMGEFEECGVDSPTLGLLTDYSLYPRITAILCYSLLWFATTCKRARMSVKCELARDSGAFRRGGFPASKAGRRGFESHRPL